MARLSIRLLGPFEVSLDDQPATQFDSDKVRALLAYLVTKGDQPHRRETLAALLWPEMPDDAARANLRYALANLRSAIGDREADPPFLDVTWQTIQSNRGSDAWADVWSFTSLLGEGRIRERTVQELEDAVELVRGEFLEGLGLRDSLPFEEWLLLQREHLARLRLAALHRLTAFYQAQGAYQPALRYAWQQVALEPYEEEAQQQLIHLLALTGQRSAALAQYDALRQLLMDELGVKPSAETRALYRSILSGEIAPVEEALRDRIIRGYDLLEQVGVGTFGAVFRAYQPVLGREVAIKVILPEYANRPEFIRRFEAEAQTVARLEHPHIVPLYDYWREPEGAYLVMRLLPSGSLKDALARGPWAVAETARAVDQLASALAAAHGQGVIHRDVKPANILLDEIGNVYLSDFSIARDVAALSLPFSRLRPPAASAARPSGAVPDTLTVSPEYAAPEQWQGVPLTPAVDVYSLGMVLYEMLAGAHPFAGIPADQLQGMHLREPLPLLSTSHPELGTDIDAVLERATAKSPRDRYSEPAVLARAFHEAAQRAVGRVMPVIEIPRPEPQNPYKGLRPFQEADAPHFFGRDAVVEQLVERLGAEDALSRFLAVVGPSGSGKSSLVRAGLVPALRGGTLPGSENWFIVTMQPGTSPLEELAAGLRGVAVRDVEGLQGVLAQDEPRPGQGLLRAAEMVLPERDAGPHATDEPQDALDLSGRRDCELLLVVDQFEEFYAPEVDSAEREHFWQMVHAAVTEGVDGAQSRVRVVITLRADFYDRPLMHPQVSQLLRGRTEVLVPLTADELAEAIKGPAEQAGVDLEPGLLGAIVADVAEEPGALPMFQYALTELFERRAGRLLTWQAYQDIGGVSGALARSAEAVYAGLDEACQAAARQVFLRLVTPGEGVEDTRRRVLLQELMAVQTAGVSAQAEEEKPSAILDAILGAFGRARLLLFDRDPVTRAPTVEVAHEALLRAWARLRAWLEESWSDLRMARLLAVATGEWLEAGRDPGFLLRGTRLAQFEGWAADSTVALTQNEGAFLEASVTARKEREAEREAQRRRELETARALAEEQRKRAEAERERAEGQAKAARRLRRRALYLAGALLVVLLLAVTAAMFGQRASENANLAATGQAEAEAETCLRTTAQAGAEEEAWLRATAQMEAEEEARLRATSQAEAEAETRLRATAQSEAEAETRLRATAQADAIRERDVAEEQSRISASRELAAAALNVLEEDPELSTLLALRALEEAQTQEVEYALHQAIPSLRLVHTFASPSDAISGLAVSPDGGFLATASQDGTVRLWRLALPDTPSDPDAGREAQIVVESGQQAPSPEQPLSLEHPSGAVSVAFGPTADLSGERSVSLLATGSNDGTLRVWQLSIEDTIQAREVYTIPAHTGAIADVAFSPDGIRLATAGLDATAKIWDVASGEELFVLAAHASGVNRRRPWAAGIADLEFSPDGTRLGTAGADGSARVWDLTSPDAASSGQKLPITASRAGATFGIGFSPDGVYVATVSERGRTRVWDAESDVLDSPARLFISQLGESVVFCPDGACLAVLGTDGITRIWDIVDGQELLVLPSHKGAWVLAFVPGASRVVTAGADGTAKLWDITASREVLTMTGTGSGVAFSPDGEYLALGAPGGATVWEMRAPTDSIGAEPWMTLSGHERGVNNVVFGPDATFLVTAGTDGTARIWDMESGQQRLSLAGHKDRVSDVALSADGAYVATASVDRTAKVWDTKSGQELVTLETHIQVVYSVAFHPELPWLATASRDGKARLWDLSPLSSASMGTSDPVKELYSFPATMGAFDVAFSPDGTRLAVSDAVGVITVWDIMPLRAAGALGGGAGSEEPRQILTLRGHSEAVTRIAFSRDGTRIATVSYDTTARVWNAATGQEEAILTLSDAMLTGVALSPDGRYLATTGGGIMHLYALQLEDLVALSRERLTRDLTDRECQRYLHLNECPPGP